MSESGKIRVLVVDDSAIVRRILTEALSEAPDIEVVGAAPDPFVAQEKIDELKPDVLTLDIEMPRMDGLTYLRKLMRSHPMPVVVISSLTQNSCNVAMEALRVGAVEVLGKPAGPYSLGELRHTVASKVRSAAATRQAVLQRQCGSPPPALPAAAPFISVLPEVLRRDAVIAIGASTGGTEAIERILRQMPPAAPGIVITQHIPPVFSRAFADRLNQVCPVRVREASNGDRLEHGQALVAPGDFHMLLRRSGAGYRVEIKHGPRICYQRPSVDVLFRSVAESAKASAVGVLLTGMGADGAQGMLAMKQAGAWTIAQDEDSCVVFGMPREAIKLGAAAQVAPLDHIPAAIVSKARRRTTPQ